MPLIQNDPSDLVRYSAWASKRLLAFTIALPPEGLARAISNSHGDICRTFQHIYYGDRIWLAWLDRAELKEFADPEPGPTLDQLDRLWWPLLDRLAICAQSEDAEQPFQHWYNGETYMLARHTAVVHIVNHATYHRGQIAAMLRQRGYAPPSTDLVLYQFGL